jgi:cellulose synthase operon protein C
MSPSLTFKSLAARRLVALTAVISSLTLVACGSDSAKSLVASGKELSAKRDFKGAVVQYKSALQKDPKSTETRYLLGKALLDAGDPTNAVVELSKALDQNYAADDVVPALARALLLTGETKKLTTLFADTRLDDRLAIASLKSSLATAWGMQGDRERTEQAVVAAVAAKPDYGPAVILQARLMAGRGEYDKAIEVVDQLVAREPRLYEAWHLKGEILWHTKNDPKAAEVAFRKALEIERAYVPSHLALVQIPLRERDFAGAKAQSKLLRAALPKHPQTTFVDAQIAFFERDFLQARELIQQLLKGAPNHLGVLQLAGAIEGQSGSLLMAQHYFGKAVQISPDLLVARRNLAQTYLRLGQAQKALDTLQPLLTPTGVIPDAFALAGEAQLQLGDPRSAEANFLRAVKLAPDNVRVRTALALSALARGEDASGFAELESMSAKDKDTFVDMAIVSVRLKRRENDLALRAALSMAKKQPENAAVYNTIGRVQMARRDYTAARSAFEQALKLDPQLFGATASLSGLDVLEKRPEQAQARLQATIKAEPRNHLARVALAELRLTSGAPADEVTRILTEAVKASPAEPTPRLMLIERAVKARQYKDALALAQEAAAVLPNDTEVLDALGRAQAESGDRQQALGTFKRLAAADPRSGLAHVRLADVYKNSGDSAAAESALKKALEIQPELYAAQAGLMELLLNGKRNNDALDVARRMQQRRPTDPAGYLFEAAMHLRNKTPDAAIATYKTGLERTGGTSDLAVSLHKAYVAAGRNADADAWGASWMKSHPEDLAFDYQLSLAAISRSDLAGAEERLKRIVVRRPGHALALNNLAWVMTVRGKPGAVEHARRAVEIMPDRPAFMDTLAMALSATQQANEALTIQKRAVDLAPNDLGLRLNLAKIAAQAGDTVLARKELNALDAVGPTLPFREEVVKLLKTL